MTKSIAAICVLRLVDQGLIALDEPLAAYWPEFGANGKQCATVRDMLAHRAGVPFVDGEVTLLDLEQPQRMANRLAQQTPLICALRPARRLRG